MRLARSNTKPKLLSVFDFLWLRNQTAGIVYSYSYIDTIRLVQFLRMLVSILAEESGTSKWSRACCCLCSGAGCAVFWLTICVRVHPSYCRLKPAKKNVSFCQPYVLLLANVVAWIFTYRHFCFNIFCLRYHAQTRRDSADGPTFIIPLECRSATWNFRLL